MALYKLGTYLCTIVGILFGVLFRRVFYLNGNQFDSMHFLEVFFGGVSAIGTCGGFVFAMWWKFKKQKDDTAETERMALLQAAQLNEKKTIERHEENVKILKAVSENVSELTTALELNPPHEHEESNTEDLPANTPLTIGGIRYRKLRKLHGT